MNCKVMRKQFKTLADPGKVPLITWTNKEHLLKIVASHQPGEPFKLDDLMDYELTENTTIHHLKKASFDPFLRRPATRDPNTVYFAKAR